MRITPIWWAGLTGCLVLAAVLRIWGGAANSGHGNSYYTAAALSMSEDWTTFLVGGLDTEGFISMDKPAVWLWPSALLIKIFGMNWATLFLPNAIAGVVSVLVLALTVREAAGDGRASHAAALLAALGLAISPMNVAIDRDNHPDTFMLLALLLAAWMVVRAVRRARLTPLLGAAALVGLAFDAKYLQAFIVVPAMALAWLVCGAGSMARRIAWLGGAAASLLAAAAVWPILVVLVPDGQRPWIGSSDDGTVFDRLKGLVGDHLESAPAGQGPGAEIAAAFHTGEVFHSGTAGVGRLFSGVPADQISWWLPSAVLAAVTMAIGLRGRGRNDSAVAALVLWSGWALTCWAVFSFMGGVLHPYYTSMLMPALAALSAGGLVTAWVLWRRGAVLGTVMLAAQVLVVAGWSARVLEDTSASKPGWLTPVVLAAAAIAVAGVLVGNRPPFGVGVAGLIAVAMLAAPVVWSIKTTDQRLFGANPLANQEGRYRPAAMPPPLGEAFLGVLQKRADERQVAYLLRNRGDARWIAAVATGMEAAPLTVAADGAPVMAMGGFTGNDPTPTLRRFQEWVRSGEIRFVLVPPPGPGFAALITGPAAAVNQWALKTCRPTGPRTAPAGGPVTAQGAPPQGAPQGAPPQAAPPQAAPPQGAPPQGAPGGGGLILLDCKGAE